MCGSAEGPSPQQTAAYVRLAEAKAALDAFVERDKNRKTLFFNGVEWLPIPSLGDILKAQKEKASEKWLVSLTGNARADNGFSTVEVENREPKPQT